MVDPVRAVRSQQVQHTGEARWINGRAESGLIDGVQILKDSASGRISNKENSWCLKTWQRRLNGEHGEVRA